MLHQQSVYLQEMGITHWQVRKPSLFAKGSGFPIRDLSRCKLLIVCSAEEFKAPLTNAILTAFGIKKSEACYCTLEQFENQQGDLPEIIWSTLGNITQLSGHALLTSPSIKMLSHQPNAKKQLWEQFCAL